MEFGAFHPRQIPISDDCRAHKIELDDALDVSIILFQQSESHGAIRFTHSFTMTRAAAETCRLDFRAVFHLNVNVPPNGEVSSLAGIADHGPAAFRTTHWSVVLTAQDDSPAAHEALEKLCRTYWRPIYGFREEAGRRPRGSGRSYSGFFCATAGTPRFRYCPQRERSPAFLFAHIAQAFSDERAEACHGNQAGRRPALDSVGSISYRRTCRVRVRGYINCRPNLRAPLGMGVDGASNEEVRRRVSNSRQRSSVRTFEDRAHRRSGSPVTGADRRRTRYD